MRICVLLIIAWVVSLSVMLGIAYSMEVSLAWDENKEPDLAGYHVYESGRRVATVAAATITLKGYSTARKYTWNVTAYNASGIESGFSNSVSLTIPESPLSLHILTGGLEIR